MATVIVEASDASSVLHQAAESVRVGHPVFIAANVLDNPKLTWPCRFLDDDKQIGRVLRTTSEVIDFASLVVDPGGAFAPNEAHR